MKRDKLSLIISPAPIARLAGKWSSKNSRTKASRGVSQSMPAVRGNSRNDEQCAFPNIYMSLGHGHASTSLGYLRGFSSRSVPLPRAVLLQRTRSSSSRKSTGSCDQYSSEAGRGLDGRRIFSAARIFYMKGVGERVRVARVSRVIIVWTHGQGRAATELH
jgi:hypothetical protein